MEKLVSSTTSDADLQRRAAAGEQAAWKEIIDRYGPPVWAVLIALGLNRLDAEDAWQRCFEQLLKAVRAGNHLDAPGQWLKQVGRNEAYRIARSQSRTTPLTTELEHVLPAPGSVEDAVVSADNAERIRRAHAKLDEKCWEILLHYAYRKSYAEISEYMDINYNSVSNTIGRCLENLRRLF